MTPAREGAGDTVGVGVGDGWERYSGSAVGRAWVRVEEGARVTARGESKVKRVRAMARAGARARAREGFPLSSCALDLLSWGVSLCSGAGARGFLFVQVLSWGVSLYSGSGLESVQSSCVSFAKRQGSCC